MRSLLSLLVINVLFAISAAGFAAPETVTLFVPGMNCPVCPITVKKALTRVKGVSSVTVDYPRKQATVNFDDQRATIETLMQATANAGYPSRVKSR